MVQARKILGIAGEIGSTSAVVQSENYAAVTAAKWVPVLRYLAKEN